MFDKLVSFGQSTMDEEILTLAENLLVWYICKDKNVKTFNHLRNIVYHKKSKELDLKKLPTAPSNLNRAYLQTHILLHSAFMESIKVNCLEYGYELKDGTEEQ